ncbi:mannosyltransferase putative-domain-containing protein [Pseudoneurospora amorphoporcata]|uniref:Mannosyltransferase putative-domain-containing protein n=1 Tax=Pseudoneurospora amorphoporcata TaxID=241081 RepID=A0AAN6NP72_9PEZI|nr:mannosyltransferase putative-domain-containing protein [Pseudoneurospora amorphoporcata]
MVVIGSSPNLSSLKCIALILPLLFTIIYFYHHRPALLADESTRLRLLPHTPNDFWVEFFARLEAVRPNAPPLNFEQRADAVDWRPDFDRARPEIWQPEKKDVDALASSHAAFIKTLPDFARHLPYDADTTGIVTTAGKGNFGQVITLLVMTRQSGSKLPIQIVLDASSVWIDNLCANLVPHYNAACIYLEDIWARLDPAPPKFDRFQWKFLAMVASTFQNILFLDADIIMANNPDKIFASGAEPLKSTGFIAWPDFWAASGSKIFYQVAGGIPVPQITDRATSESGMIVLDKARHADTLLLASYYNYHGPSHYMAMLSQHGPGEGDKETFLQAAYVLEELARKGSYSPPMEWTKLPSAKGQKKGFYDVKKMPVSHGRSANGKWRGMFMKQMDPVEDWRALQQAAKKAKHRAPANTRSPYLFDSSWLSTVGNLTLQHDQKKIMFFHHNGVKPDFADVVKGNTGLVEKDEKTGKLLRMWGDPKWIIETTGRDLEKILWLSTMEVWCRLDEDEFDDVCGTMSEIYDEVYTDHV